MKSIHLIPFAFAALLPLVACGQAEQPGNTATATAPASSVANASTTTGISGAIHREMDQAKREMATKPIDVNSISIGGDKHAKDARPKAEITPQGDLLIAGKQIPATPAQRDLLLAYRQQIISIASAGMDIGARGADLGMRAARQAMWGALFGKSDAEIEAAIKPQTDQIEAAAHQLCRRLPTMLTAQQQLAAAMPEFKPYATMTQKDIDDCGKDTAGKKGAAVFSD